MKLFPIIYSGARDVRSTLLHSLFGQLLRYGRRRERELNELRHRQEKEKDATVAHKAGKCVTCHAC